MTRSSFLQSLYDLEDAINALTIDDLGTLEDLIDQIRDLRDDCQDSLDNVPYQLQETSPGAIILQERIDALDDWIGDLENIDVENLDVIDSREDALQAILDEVQACSPGL